MILSPELARYCKTAKRGTWQKLGSTIKTLKKINFDSYVCDFSTRTDGSFFVLAEGLTEYELLLVAPDDSINITAMGSMTCLNALRYVSTYISAHDIPGWVEFVEWFDGKYSTFGGMISSATICGCSVSSIPSYSNPTHDVATWFTWIITCGERASGFDLTQMSDYRENSTTFSLPLTLGAAGLTINMEMKMAV